MTEQLFMAAVLNAVVATALAGVVWIAVRFVRRPDVRQVLWLLVLLKFIVPPIVAIPVFLTSTAESNDPPIIQFDRDEALNKDSATDGSAVRAEGSTVATPPVFRQPVVTDIAVDGRFVFSVTGNQKTAFLLVSGIWVAGTLVLLVSTFSRGLAVAKLVRRSALAAALVRKEVESVALQMGLRTAPTVRMSTARIAPFVCTIGRGATLLLPSGLLTVMTPDERSTVIRHELAHLRRRDHLLIWFELIVVCLFWWHPVVWMAHRRSRRAAELCCDAEVLASRTQSPEVYAQALLMALDFVSEGGRTNVALASFLCGHVRHLKGRLEMILKNEEHQSMGWRTRYSLAAVVCSVLAMTPVLLSADEKEQPDSKKSHSAEPLRMMSINGRNVLVSGELTVKDGVDVKEVKVFMPSPLPESMKHRKGTYYANGSVGYFKPDDEKDDKKHRLKEIIDRQTKQRQKAAELRQKIEQLKKEGKTAEAQSAMQELQIRHLQMQSDNFANFIAEQFEERERLIERIESLEKQVKDLSTKQE